MLLPLNWLLSQSYLSYLFYFPYLSNISSLTHVQMYAIVATLTIIPIKLNISLFNYDIIYEPAPAKPLPLTSWWVNWLRRV